MADKTEKSKEEKQEFVQSPVVEKRKRKGKVVRITSSRIIVDVNGNGEEIKFDIAKHSKVKVNDEIELS